MSTTLGVEVWNFSVQLEAEQLCPSLTEMVPWPVTLKVSRKPSTKPPFEGFAAERSHSRGPQISQTPGRVNSPQLTNATCR